MPNDHVWITVRSRRDRTAHRVPGHLPARSEHTFRSDGVPSHLVSRSDEPGRSPLRQRFLMLDGLRRFAVRCQIRAGRNAMSAQQRPRQVRGRLRERSLCPHRGQPTEPLRSQRSSELYLRHMLGDRRDCVRHRKYRVRSFVLVRVQRRVQRVRHLQCDGRRTVPES